MRLVSGGRLGPYEIISNLGAGGMGEVYRARDTRLDRTVAIKVLLEHLSSRSEPRERFEREARAVSSLNHPHICTLYDVGHQDGIDFLVMERHLRYGRAKGTVSLRTASVSRSCRRLGDDELSPPLASYWLVGLFSLLKGPLAKNHIWTDRVIRRSSDRGSGCGEFRIRYRAKG